MFFFVGRVGQFGSHWFDHVSNMSSFGLSLFWESLHDSSGDGADEDDDDDDDDDES